MESVVYAEGRNGWAEEGVTDGGIVLKLVGMLGNGNAANMCSASSHNVIMTRSVCFVMLIVG